MIKLKVILFSYLSLFMFGVVDSMRGPLYPDLIASWGVTQKVGALFFALSSFFSFLFGMGSAYFLKNWGVRNIFFLGLFLMFFSALISYLSFHFAMILVGAVFMGLSMGMLGLSQNTLISHVSESHNSTRLMSGLHSMYALASLLSPLIYNIILAQFEGDYSKYAFLLLTIFCFFIFVFTYIFFPPFSLDPTGEKNSSVELIFNYKEIFTKKYSMAFAISLYVVSEVIIGSRLPFFLQKNLNMSAVESNYYLLGYFAAFLIARTIVSFVEIKIQRTFLIISLGISCISYFLGLYVHPFMWIVTAFFQAPFYPIAMAFLKEVYHTGVAKVIALTLTMTSLFLMVSHEIFGLISDYNNSFIAMHLGFIALLVGVILFYFSSKSQGVISGK